MCVCERERERERKVEGKEKRKRDRREGRVTDKGRATDHTLSAYMYEEPRTT